MKKCILWLMLLAIAASCGQSEQKKLLTEIEMLETQLLQTGDAGKNEDVALQLVEKSHLYAMAWPQDSLSPILLFKAAEVARGARQYGKAVQLFGEVWRKYVKHQRAPMALFLQAFTFDNDLRQSQMATRYYQQFLEKYPNDSLVVQVRQLLAVVGENPDELVKKFEKNQQE